MLKPKMVFTALATWFAFHLIIFWILNPMGVEAIIADEKGHSTRSWFFYGNC